MQRVSSLLEINYVVHLKATITLPRAGNAHRRNQ